MTTVTAVKRALEETSRELSGKTRQRDNYAQAILELLRHSPTVVTILANRLSDRGTAGNEARARNLAQLGHLCQVLNECGEKDNATALQWAIDQLTPPEPAL